MGRSRLRLLARLALAAFAAGCAIWLLRLDHAAKISTNVVDLIPPAEQAPELGLVRGFASNVQSRVMLFALQDPATPGAAPQAAAREFAAELGRAPEFAEAIVIGDPVVQDALGREVFAQRFSWLLPSWLGRKQRDYAATGQPADGFAAWLAEGAAVDLEAFLSRPEATAMQDLLPRDPLLLVPGLLDRARLLGGPAPGAGGRALVWARIRVSPFLPEGQGPVFAVVERALARARETTPGVALRWSGINRFAAASRSRIAAEIKGLNLVSVVGVLAVSCLFVRRVHRLLHLLPVIGLSLAGAWTISTLAFDRLHVLVFVIGSLLSGVAVDYGFYLFMQPLYPDETYGGKLRRLLKPLLASCLTTVTGFSLLLFSDLPLIRQIGLFVSAGLLCALGAAMLYFAQLGRTHLEGRALDWTSRLGGHSAWRGLARGGLAAAGLVALAGLLRLQWRDDVRELDLPAPELHANEAELRSWFGESAGRSVFLTHGPTLAAARERLEAFVSWRERTEPAGAVASVGLLLPTEADWRALPDRLRQLGPFADEFGRALERHGFTREAFAPFLASWEDLRARPPAMEFAALAAGLDRALTGPLALLSNRTEAPYWFLSLVDAPDVGEPPPELSTIGLNQLQSLNDLFTRYRWSALRLSLAGLGLVILSVFVIYPPARGLRIALLPAGSCAVVFGVFGLAGFTLNLFHLLGAFLGVCLSHNYAIFSADQAHQGAPPPVPVRLSACSTVVSFGVLGFSRIPVIHALGLTVALIVFVTLLIVELEPVVRRRP